MKAVAWGDGGVTDDMPYPPCGLPLACSNQVREDFYVTQDEIVEYLKDSDADDESDDSSIKEYLAGPGSFCPEHSGKSIGSGIS